MQDKIKTGFEGYFKIECIKDGKVIDSFEEHNTIMRSARRSMAEIFLNSKNNSKEFANIFQNQKSQDLTRIKCLRQLMLKKDLEL